MNNENFHVKEVHRLCLFLINFILLNIIFLLISVIIIISQQFTDFEKLITKTDRNYFLN